MRIFRYICMAVAMLVIAACDDTATPSVVTMKVELSADKSSLYADGLDKVTFTVTADGADVTGLSQITMDGVGIAGNTFSTRKVGRSVFKAVYEGVESDAFVVEALEPVAIDSKFVKHVAVWEFTGAWCTFCPSGYSNMNFVISRNADYKSTVHIMAFHSGLSGEDALAVPETDRIMSDKKVGDGFPSFLTDLRISGGLSDGNAFKASLEETFRDYPAHCGVAVSSEVNGTTVKVKATVASELTSSYRLALFVVEDNVKYYQKDGSLTHKEFNHRHVVRKVVSETYVGDRVGDVKAGEEASKEYVFDVDAAWNLDNTYIYALAVDYQGFVNNMNRCGINGRSDYNRK